MGLLRVNHFSDISGYAHALDLFFVVAFLYILNYSIREFRRGNRFYLVATVTAIIYGFVLEVSGMLWHASYTQGEFWLMWDFRQFEAFKDSTDMPFYVPLFYPVWLITALKLIEPLGIRNPAPRAIAIGVAGLLMYTPYILMAPHVGWWEWHEWRMYQLWMGWPLLDGLWELTWHALLFWMLFRVFPKLDGYYQRNDNRANLKALLLWPFAVALAVNIIGPILMMPASVPTVVLEAQGFRHYPIVVLYALVAGTILLFSQKDIQPCYFTAKDLFLPLLYLITFTAMTVYRLEAEGGFRDYLLVQAMGLYACAMLLYYPRYCYARHRAGKTQSAH